MSCCGGCGGQHIELQKEQEQKQKQEQEQKQLAQEQVAAQAGVQTWTADQ